jgi:hypothetical protein
MYIPEAVDLAAAEVFVFTGERGAEVPDDVVRLQVDPSVASIPALAFNERRKLIEVKLFEGLVEIGERSFDWCIHSIKEINFPTSLRRISDRAFTCTLRCPIRLQDGIESIGIGAFANCIFTNFRVPPLITVIPEGMLHSCTSMFSVEMSETLSRFEEGAFCKCHCLRNVAFPPDAVIDDDILHEAADLLMLFGDSVEEIIWELQYRFDGLPIHKLIYYQSYHQGVLQFLVAAIYMRSGQRRSLRSKLNPTGNQQDCLGMTPLHILTCSCVHDLELYRVIVENYPTNLIAEDRWGATPLMYAFWGAAPAEIIQFLIESYQSLYPSHVFNWTMMVKTMGRTETPKESIMNLLCAKQMHFPEQPIDWDNLLDEIFVSPPCNFSIAKFHFQERMLFLVMCGMAERVKALAFSVWRDCITNMIQSADYDYYKDNLSILHGIQRRIAHFEDELPKLKEAITILELALWKMKINKNGHNNKNQTHFQKKMKADDSIIRSQNRVTCGADIVIGHVLPFLI